MWLLKLIPTETNFRFMRFRHMSFPFSALLSILAVVTFVTLSMNFGIDFKGGTLFELRTLDGKPADIGGLRAQLGRLGLGEVEVQELGQPSDVLVRVELQPGGDAAQKGASDKVREAIGAKFEMRRNEVVGPRVSSELVESGTLGIIFGLLAILIYLWFRFEWQFAVGGVIATLHDLVLTIGFFAITRFEFNMTSIAAILTIVGYSINDTVVVYDRIRESMRRYKKMPIEDLLDLAMNATLTRTLITGVSAFLVLVALIIWGGETLNSFGWAMLFGLVVGTYSSVFVASPVLIYLGLKAGAFEARKESDAASETVRSTA
jgi:preprotein translocase subunit SecF